MKKTLLKLYIGSFLASVFPLVVLVLFRWDDYVKSVPAGAVRLSIGCIMAAIVLLLKITDHLHISSKFAWYVGLSLFCWLMQAVLKDMMLVFICAAIGEGIDEAFFQTAIKKTQKERDMKKQAQVIIEQMEKAGKAE